MSWKDFPEEYKVGGRKKDRHTSRLTGILGQTNGELTILTLEGAVAVNPGDWVVRGIEGELYPVKEDIFFRTYEEINDQA